MTDTRPEFAVALRGYERTQVEAYVARLHQRLAEAEGRSETTDPPGDRPDPRPGGPDDVDTGELPVPGAVVEDDFARLGGRVAAILRLAEEDAAERRARGEREAQELLDRARTDTEELRRSVEGAAEEVRAARAGAEEDARAILDGARQEADDLLQRTRRHAEDQAEGIVTQAEVDARRILEEARATARAALEEAERRRADQEATTQALLERQRRIAAELTRLRATLAEFPAEAPAEPVRPEGERTP